MKEVHYTDKHGREVTKKEGFSWITFWLLFIIFFPFAFIYMFAKGGFNAIREATRLASKKKISK